MKPAAIGRPLSSTPTRKEGGERGHKGGWTRAEHDVQKRNPIAQYPAPFFRRKWSVTRGSLRQSNSRVGCVSGSSQSIAAIHQVLHTTGRGKGVKGQKWQNGRKKKPITG